MKNLYYSIITLVLVSLFVSCDPIVDEKGVGELITSADQIEATITPIIQNGKNTNKVKVHCTSPVSCQWTDGVNTYTTTETEMTLLLPGKQTLTLSAMAADGKIYEKKFEYNVELMFYPVPPQYAYFCGSGEKKWTWADKECFGNGGGSDQGPAWWKLNPADIKEQCEGKKLPLDGVGATMQFVLNGKKMIKTTMDGVVYEGKFNFDMTNGVTGWSLGTLTFANTNILCGYDFNDAKHAAWTTYNIIYLDDKKMVLGAQEHAPNTNYWYWVFKAL